VKFFENKILTPVLYNIVNQIVCVSSEIREELISSYYIRKSLLQVVTNGIDYHGIVQKATEPITQNYDKVFKREVVVFCGRLAPQKNPLVLLDIIHEALKTRDFNLLIIGDGPMLDEMKHRCSILNLAFIDINEGQFDSSEARVYFTGFQQNPFALMKRSSVFILTSDFEGYPLIVCEALACGLPVIATDCPTGVREILSDKVVERRPISDSEFETFGVLMPLVNRFSADFSIRIQLWSNMVIKLLDDSVLKSSYAQRAKERAATLDVKYFFYKWDSLLNELQ
jgi:glycosyltransferase involved in cell wall biosynthesis